MERRGRGKNPWKSPFVARKVGVSTPGGAGIPRDGRGALSDLPQASAILEIVQRNLVIKTRLTPDRLGFSPAGLTAKRRASQEARERRRPGPVPRLCGDNHFMLGSPKRSAAVDENADPRALAS